MDLRGCGTALVTPFRHDGAVDEAALRELVAWQVDSGIDFLVPCGTTGETPTLSRKEWLRVIEITVEVAAGRVPIVAGATSNSTRDAIEKARAAAERNGVDAILTASPYYNKPTQEGQFHHFRAIAQAIRKPLILYNVPGRTGANIEPATLARLASIRNIIGVKEASGNISQIVEVFNAVPSSFLVFSGDDAITLPMMALGGVGVISVASNEIPREMAELTRAALNNDWDTARRLHRRYLPLMMGNFLESNPVPVKAVLAMMGKIREVYRLPLVRMKEETRTRLQKIAAEAGLPMKPMAPRPPARAAAASVSPSAGESEATESAATEQPETAAAAPDISTSQPVPDTVAQEQPSDAASTPESTPSANAEESSVSQPGPPDPPVAQSSSEPIPETPAAPPEPIAFYVYENWQAGPHKTVLHRSTCVSCRNGKSQPKGQDEAHSRWYGPFASAQEARDAARGLNGILIRSECKCISRG